MVHDAGDVFAPQVPGTDDRGQFIVLPENGGGFGRVFLFQFQFKNA